MIIKINFEKEKDQEKKKEDRKNEESPGEKWIQRSIHHQKT